MVAGLNTAVYVRDFTPRAPARTSKLQMQNKNIPSALVCLIILAVGKSKKEIIFYLSLVAVVICYFLQENVGQSGGKRQLLVVKKGKQRVKEPKGRNVKSEGRRPGESG